MKLLAIDPGKSCGWAVFETPDTVSGPSGYFLVACGLSDGDDPHFSHCLSFVIDRIVCERPSGSDRRAPSDDLVTCGIRAGLVVGYARSVSRTVIPSVEWVYAVQWKGSTPKAIQNQRDLMKLTTTERVVLEHATRKNGKKLNARSQQHNVLDAIGIGLWSVKR